MIWVNRSAKASYRHQRHLLSSESRCHLVDIPLMDRYAIDKAMGLAEDTSPAIFTPNLCRFAPAESQSRQRETVLEVLSQVTVLGWHRWGMNAWDAEAEMTQDRRFKKRVRARMVKTGESYSAASHHLRKRRTEEPSMAENEFQSITNPDFGYTLKIPTGWRNVGPDIYNSVYEVARYLRTNDRLHDGIVNLFWDIPGDSPRQAAETGDCSVFDLNRDCLLKEGIEDISIEDVTIASRSATRLDHAYKLGDIENWASRSYFLSVRNTLICLNMGTSNVEADTALYDRIADSFHVIENAVGIVMVRDGETPGDFITGLLQTAFNYRQQWARQRVVQMNAQRESVIALVDADDAAGVVESVNEQCRQAGYALTCRVAGA